MHISIHWDNDVTSGESNHPFGDSQFFYSRLQYESLEGLIDFLAFLVLKLWPNFRVLIREIP